MQKSNQWQWGVIFIGIFVVVGILFATSFILNSSEEVSQKVNQSESTADASDAPSDNSQNEAGEQPEENIESKPTEIVVSEKVKTGEYVQIITLLAELKIQEEVNSDTYDRNRFRHWVNVEEKCSAREYTLREESLKKVSYKNEEECEVTSGEWFSLYDSVTLYNSSGVDIDHMVPLKEAWESGAHAWNDSKRRSYANDIADPRSLIAVSASSNRSKSDRDPQDWMPSAKKYACTYVSDWVAVKYRWELTVDIKERETLISYAEKCADEVVLVPSKG